MKNPHFGGRIIAVADAFSAMAGDRVYHPALPLDRAWAELRAHCGSQIDPEVVEAFELVVDEEGRAPAGPDLERTPTGEVQFPNASA